MHGVRSWGEAGKHRTESLVPVRADARALAPTDAREFMSSQFNRSALTLCILLSSFALAAEIGPSIEARDAWIRWLPANVPSGGYLTLINTGTVPRVLIGAVSPDFGAISFHESVTKNGVSDMVAVDSLTLGPRGSLRFSPGGYHFMLMQPKRALHPGDRVLITLHFADGYSLAVPFEVRTAGDMGKMPGMEQ